jgi:predicted acylesterase/phospholipase RssA
MVDGGPGSRVSSVKSGAMSAVPQHDGGRPRRLRVALALSSGGARGFAHVGVIKALRRAGIEIAHVAGTSMGSIMAAGYALRGDVDELERWVLAWRPRDHTRRGLLSLLGLPIMDPRRITDFLDASLGGARIGDCAVPLSIVATDLRRREPATLTAGPLALAVFASMAMPFLHRPVPWEGRLLAEGALSCVLPLAQARAAPPGSPGPVDLVVGSLVANEARRLGAVLAGLAHSVGRAAPGWPRHYARYFRGRPRPSARGHHTSLPAAPPVLVISPDFAGIGALEFGKVREAIAAGERAALAALAGLRAAAGHG